MPKYTLANFLYYGHETLPEDVRTAFQESTHVERMLVSWARASRISFRFCDIKGHQLEGTTRGTSQSCIKGNVATHPQDAPHLNAVLPPSSDAIRDTICAVFVGKTKPTSKTIKSLRPVLARKSCVKKMIDFLTESNENYEVSDLFREGQEWPDTIDEDV